ncbi:MAG: hypothetical protein AAF483_29945, partial [Planctomycetota bacterium]
MVLSLSLALTPIVLVGCFGKSKEKEPVVEGPKDGVQVPGDAESTAIDEQPIEHPVDNAALEGEEPEGNADIDIPPNPESAMVQGDSSPGATAEKSTDEKAPPKWVQEGTWSTRRMVALGDQGPTIIDLSISVDSRNLQEASTRVAEKIAEELFQDLEEPVSWEQLVEMPLVKSGWLGN